MIEKGIRYKDKKELPTGQMAKTTKEELMYYLSPVYGKEAIKDLDEDQLKELLDELTEKAKKTQSVNTIYLGNRGTVGDNTDVDGFKSSLKNEYDVKNKNIFILGAGGVVPSIIFALKDMGAKNIMISNRTQEKAENLKKIFNNIKIVDWGKIPNFDMIINATSIGLNIKDEIKLDFSKIKNKFFYDIIYNPSETNFLKVGKTSGNKTLNGKLMFIYQAYYAFSIWHNLSPKIDDGVIKLLNND